MNIIGLTAKKGSGKDTVADYLVLHHGYIKVSFAQFIKECAINLFQWTDEHFEHDKKEKVDEYWNITPRYFLQQFGTNFLRNFTELNSLSLKIYNNTYIHGNFTFHIKRLNLYINSLYEQNIKKIVITDIRFEDEYKYVKSLGSKIIRIKRKHLKENKFSNHESESFIDTFQTDIIIENNSTKQQLYSKINSFINNECKNKIT